MAVAKAENEVRPGDNRLRTAHARTVVVDGCRVAPRCLECPLEHCIYEADHAERQREELRQRAEAIITCVREHGRTAAAERFGLAKETVRRLEHRYRARGCG